MDAAILRRGHPADARELAEAQVDTWRTTYPGLVPQAYLDRLSYGTRTRRWQGVLTEPPARSTVWVAEQGGAIIGFAVGGARRGAEAAAFDGELYAIYIRAGRQRQGLGTRLVHAIAADLRHAGFRSALVWVLAGNSACRFYEGLGGRLVAHRTVVIGGAPLEELGYGWEDLKVL